MEAKREKREPDYQRIIRIAIVTARSAPSNERVATTLNDWCVVPEETIFLGGIEKKHVLEIMQPHMFFDDQMRHLSSVAGNIPSVHVPFGIRNHTHKK